MPRIHAAPTLRRPFNALTRERTGNSPAALVYIKGLSNTKKRVLSGTTLSGVRE